MVISKLVYESSYIKEIDISDVLHIYEYDLGKELAAYIA